MYCITAERKKAVSCSSLFSGEKFDIKDYHHAFLSSGPMALDTLEEAVDEYIKDTLNQ